MKLGEVLKKERVRKGISLTEMSQSLGLPENEYQEIEAGNSPAERWGGVLARIAIVLETPSAKLVTESGRYADKREGQSGPLIRAYREKHELSKQNVINDVNNYMAGWDGQALLTLAEYEQIEASKSGLEKYGPIFLGFAEQIEQPVFNLFYPCALPFHELDDYP
ncbi:helix-turn-helix domain-containing protein [Photobacterium sp. CCB-ST2H9]|uniref:helix-turn-helix domain-containing protein n=1 Tax=unclassified Photobacterium TaxID=2628852 RepID=UPI002002BD62|nr:helix-turn-helix transcriptional regulator [Photobacterium sp. CCB-ST2H9]UTM56812.1 helix-turn-helix domain-containing protein [Photobacterium sp. CCB-ST2H9]